MATNNEGRFYCRILFSFEVYFYLLGGPYLNDVTHASGALHILLFWGPLIFYLNLQGKNNLNADLNHLKVNIFCIHWLDTLTCHVTSIIEKEIESREGTRPPMLPRI